MAYTMTEALAPKVVQFLRSERQLWLNDAQISAIENEIIDAHVAYPTATARKVMKLVLGKDYHLTAHETALAEFIRSQQKEINYRAPTAIVAGLAVGATMVAGAVIGARIISNAREQVASSALNHPQAVANIHQQHRNNITMLRLPPDLNNTRQHNDHVRVYYDLRLKALAEGRDTIAGYEPVNLDERSFGTPDLEELTRLRAVA